MFEQLEKKHSVRYWLDEYPQVSLFGWRIVSVRLAQMLIVWACFRLVVDSQSTLKERCEHLLVHSVKLGMIAIASGICCDVRFFPFCQCPPVPRVGKHAEWPLALKTGKFWEV